MIVAFASTTTSRVATLIVIPKKRVDHVQKTVVIVRLNVEMEYVKLMKIVSPVLVIAMFILAKLLTLLKMFSIKIVL